MAAYLPSWKCLGKGRRACYVLCEDSFSASARDKVFNAAVMRLVGTSAFSLRCTSVDVSGL